MAAIKSPNLRIVKSDTDTTPDNSEFRGEYINWGGQSKKVFWEKIENRVTEEVKDHQGNVVWKRGPGGMVLDVPMRITRTEGFTERDFIVDDLGNGMTQKVYQFRPDPLEQERKDKEVRRAKLLDELFEKAEAVGGLDALLESVDEPAKPKRTKKDSAA
jgi:hypothetical protein